MVWCLIFFPSTGIRFIQDSPIVFDSNITVILEVTPTVVSYKCEVSHIGTIDCKSFVKLK